MNPGNQTNYLSLYDSMISLGFFRLFHLPDVVARSFLFSSHASFPPLFWLTNLRSLRAKLTVSPFLLADWLKSQKLVNFGSQKTVCFTLSFHSPHSLSSSPLSPSSISSFFWLLVFFLARNPDPEIYRNSSPAHRYQ